MAMNEQSPTPSPQPNGRPAPLLVIFLILPLLGILLALLMLASNNAPASPQSIVVGEPPADLDTNTASLINFQAPRFTLNTLEGAPISLEAFQGKSLFLNFWQTTCEPCKREMPAFVDFIAENEQNGTPIEVLAISFDETAEMVRAFFSQNNIDLIPLALDPDSTVRRSYGVQGIPVTFVIDDAGIVRYMHIGEMDLRQMRSYAELIVQDSQMN